MNIDISKYEEIYNTYYSKIEKAVTNIVRHPCVNLIENLTNVEDYLRKILDISSDEWNDSAKEAMDSNIQICLDNILQTKSSIETNWQKAETLYKELLELLKTLNTETMTLKTLLSEKPIKSHYMHEEGDGLGNIQITYPGYANALSIWNGECKSKNDECESYFTSINDKLEELKTIDGETLSINNSIGIIGIPFNINSEFAHFTEDADYILGLDSVEYTRGPDGKLTVRYNQKYGPWITTIDGVSLERSGCGIMSLATALTSTLSYKTGNDVIVTPLDVANSLSEYAKANGKSGLNTYFPGYMGDYEPIAEAISDIYGVKILYTNGGRLSENQVVNATDSSATIVYSLSKERHVASLTGESDTKGFMIADTGKNKASYVYGTDTFDGGKRSMIVAAGDYGISGNYLTINGSTQIPDIGPMEYIAINGQNYKIIKQNVENTDLYEYIIDFDS